MKNPSQMYSSKKNKSGLGAMLKDKKRIDAPSVVEDAPPIDFEYRELSKEEAAERCVPHKDNQRCWDKLTLGAVADIYPSIAEAGFNSELAEAVELEGKLHIIKGLRRLYSVINAPGDSKFRVLVAKQMSEEDQFARARTGDLYDSPNILDIGFRLSEKYKERGKGANMTELAKSEGIALGKVSEAISFTKFPDYIYSAFPGLRYLRYKWLRYLKSESENLSKLKGKLTALQPDDKFDSVEEAEKYSEKTFARIKSILQEPPAPVKNNPKWESFNPRKGVKVTVKGDDVSVKFNASELDSSVLDQLQNLLKN